MTSAMQLQSVTHSFNGVCVIDGISLEVKAGEIVAVVGPSGCGKSTLLRIAAGLLTPSGGSVHAHDERIGFVFQDSALLPWRKVMDNAKLLASRNDDAFVTSLLESAGLSTHLNKWPHELSGGMKMRLSLVRTLAMRPSVVLADEPFGALDQITRHHLHDELLDLHSKSPFAMVIVTHAIDEAVYLADRVITMSPAPGRFVATTEVRFDHPRTSDLRYTAAFGELCGRVASTLNDASSLQRGSAVQVDCTPKRTASRGTT